MWHLESPSEISDARPRFHVWDLFCLAPVLKVFARLFEQKQAHIVARFTGIVKRHTYCLDENHHIDQYKCEHTCECESAIERLNISEYKKDNYESDKRTDENKCRRDKFNPLDIVDPEKQF